MDIARTPEARFAALPDFPFERREVEVDGLRIAYVEAGPRDADPVLCLHGEPSWSFLWRKVIPPLAAAGHRVIAPDLVGFGRSDKPLHRRDYTYARHVGWMAGLLTQLDLARVTLVAQDWGGLIGLRLVAEHGDRFARVVVANTGLPTGDQEAPFAFKLWRFASQATPWFPASRIVRSGCVRALSPAEVAAYDAPFPSERFKAGARVFPTLVPTRPDDPASEDNRRAWKALEAWHKPLLTAFSTRDPITRGGERVFQRRVPGAQGQAHATLHRAGHFLQEDAPGELAETIAGFIARTRA